MSSLAGLRTAYPTTGPAKLHGILSVKLVKSVVPLKTFPPVQVRQQFSTASGSERAS
jgi:hypothetical protein